MSHTKVSYFGSGLFFFSCFFLKSHSDLFFSGNFSQQLTAECGGLTDCVIFRLWEEICTGCHRFSAREETQLAKNKMADGL